MYASIFLLSGRDENSGETYPIAAFDTIKAAKKSVKRNYAIPKYIKWEEVDDTTIALYDVPNTAFTDIIIQELPYYCC